MHAFVRNQVNLFEQGVNFGKYAQNGLPPLPSLRDGVFKDHVRGYRDVSMSIMRRRAFEKERSENDRVKDAVVEDVRRRQLLFFTSQLAIGAAVGLASPEQVKATQNVDQVVSQKSMKDIIVPPLDDRKYEYFTLSNGLRVLICSDPSLSTAAAAMDVHVGATSDPDTVPVSHINALVLKNHFNLQHF